jgi:hypothetical protein
VVALPFYYTLREPNETDWGLRVTLPVAIAAGNFDLYDPEISQIDDIHLAALSTMPDLELVIPIKPHWRLNSFANIGRAWEFETKAGADVFQIGMSTYYRIPSLVYPEVELGAKYTYAGYTSMLSPATACVVYACRPSYHFKNDPAPWWCERRFR